MAEIGAIAIYIIIGVVVLIVLAALFFFVFLRKKRGKKYKFLKYSKDGSRCSVIDAIIRVDKENPARKKFYFASHDGDLDIRPHSIEINGVAFRECYQDDNGELQYLERSMRDDKLVSRLLPEEKSLALSRYKEYQRRYENPMSKATAGLLIGGFILVFLIMLGVIYSTISFSTSASKQVEVARVNKEISDSNFKVSQSNERVAEQLIQVAVLLTNAEGKNGSIIRQVS